MVNFGVILVWILVATAIIVMIVFLFIRSRNLKKIEGQELKANSPLVDIFINAQNEGYSRGALLNKYTGKELERYDVVPYDGDTEDLVPNKVLKIIVQKGKAYHIGKGRWSKAREIIWLLPNHAHEINEIGFPKEFELVLEKIIEGINSASDVFKMYELGDKARKEIVDVIISRNWDSMSKGDFREKLELISETLKLNTSGGVKT